MAEFIRVLVGLPSDSGLPEDVTVNTWHFRADTPSDAGNYGNAFDVLQIFYESIAGYLSKTLSGVIEYKGYNVAEAPPRVPEALRSDTFTPSTADAIPNELAVCASFRASYQSGEPNARRRGRVYVGPLTTDAMQGASTGKVRVAPALVAALSTAGLALIEGADSVGVPLCVYSRATDASETLADSFFPIIDGWVDNAFDVQRRRGTAPDVRDVMSTH